MNPFTTIPKLLKSEKLWDNFKGALMLKSWKTSVLGAIALVMGLANIWAPPAYQQKVQQTAAVFAGLGLIAAKDHNVGN